MSKPREFWIRYNVKWDMVNDTDAMVGTRPYDESIHNQIHGTMTVQAGTGLDESG